jgi:hypothetical protein
MNAKQLDAGFSPGKQASHEKWLSEKQGAGLRDGIERDPGSTPRLGGANVGTGMLARPVLGAGRTLRNAPGFSCLL